MLFNFVTDGDTLALAMSAIRILFLAASPRDKVRLALDKEIREIEEKLKSSKHRDEIELISKWALRSSDLAQALLEHEPHVVHFSGHAGDQQIYLMDGADNTKPLSGRALANMLGVLRDNIRVVVFNACFSRDVALAMLEHIDFAVGVHATIGAQAAMAFSAAFYLALGYGRSVEAAFWLGANAPEMEGVRDQEKPVLLARSGANASAVTLVGPKATIHAGDETSSPVSTCSPVDAPTPRVSHANASSGSPIPAAPESLPQSLIDQLEPWRDKLHRGTNAVVPFVGSGLSRPALPSWYEFLQKLIGRAPAANRPAMQELLDKGSYLSLASVLERNSHVGKPIIAQEIARAFQRPKSPRPVVYDLVATLPTQHFLTTNYDPWLKEAVNQHLGTIPRTPVPDDKGAFSDISTNSPPLVVMLHGDAARPETCVLSARAYRQLQYGSPPFAHAMRALASQRSFLFLGYSLSDPDIAGVLDQWVEIFAPDGAPPRHLLLGAGLSEAAHMTLLDRAVEPLDYSPDDQNDHSMLAPILRWLALPP